MPSGRTTELDDLLLAVVKRLDKPHTAREVARMVNKNYSTVRAAMRRLLDSGYITEDRLSYKRVVYMVTDEGRKIK